MREHFTLDGMWELAGFGEDLGDWTHVEAPYPIPARVPGEVHPALQEAELIPDPFYASNVDEVQWVENKEWWYRRTFTVPKDFVRSRTFLEFAGLDTYATILLNGTVVGKTDNMFIPFRFDVVDTLRPEEENVLEVHFAHTAKIVAAMDFSDYYVRYNQQRIGARKMQASFGWDWCPRLIGAGIWRNVSLISYDRLALHALQVITEVKDHIGTARLRVEVDNHIGEPVDAIIDIVIEGHGRRITQRLATTISSAGQVVETTVEVPHPQLWWPNGLGKQCLYTAWLELRSGEELLDTAEQRFAFRTVELRERHDDGKAAFYFVINGQPVFIKGANWISCDSFPSRVPADHYKQLLALARDAHINMLRIWGGGIYQLPEFYDMCDEMGIMLWQEFMFSLAEYPDTEEFTNTVLREITDVVRRLRIHPSIVLWCGNNECEMDTEVGTAWKGKRLFHDLIPRVLNEMDSSRPYWPSSPYGGPIAHSGEFGDYHGEPWFHCSQQGIDDFRRFLESDKGLFMSEFPTQGPPEIETIERFVPEEQHFPIEGKIWEDHLANNEHRQQKIGLNSHQSLMRMITDVMGEPRSLEEFVQWGGVLQGEFLKAQIDYYRSRKFAIGGAMFWMFQDAWPAVDFSVLDYFARPKPAYHYIRRAFAPISLAFVAEQDGLELWVVNDLKEKVSGAVAINLLNFDYATETHAEVVPFTLEANDISRVWEGHLPEPSGNYYLLGQLTTEHGVSYNSHPFTRFRDIAFPVADVRVEKDYLDGVLFLHLSTDTFARCVMIYGLPDLARPDDNYFDMLPGSTRVIAIRNISGVDAEKVAVRQVLGANVRAPIAVYQV